MALPDFMPIVAARMASYRSPYVERERTEPCDLCDASGRLNPDAVGWSRRPLVRANLSGHRLRKKRWNFWNWITADFVLSATVADIDYAAFCEVTFTDFRSGDSIKVLAPAWPGTIALPDEVERSFSFRSRHIAYATVDVGTELRVSLSASNAGARPISAELKVARPPGHETLNLVVPWTRDRFQLNSKHCALPVSGYVLVDGVSYDLEPDTCHAVQDWGRGVWPWRSFWNWAVASGVQDGRSIGVNMGAKWTTGTGVNENALCIDGRLHKVSEDLLWTYDPADWRRPWRVVAPHGGMIDLTLEPRVVRTPQAGFGPVRSGGACAFGLWHGTLRFAGEEIAVRALPGWAEEFDHRW